MQAEYLPTAVKIAPGRWGLVCPAAGPDPVAEYPSAAEAASVAAVLGVPREDAHPWAVWWTRRLVARLQALGVLVLGDDGAQHVQGERGAVSLGGVRGSVARSCFAP
jgi:hypothetical protein